MIKDKVDKVLDDNPKVKDAIDVTSKVTPQVIDVVKKFKQQKNSGDKIKVVAEAVSNVVATI